MSLTVLVRAHVRNGGIGNMPAAIEHALRSVDRGRLDVYTAKVGHYQHRPTDLSILMIREVGSGWQVNGVPCERLVAEDTLAAIRSVCVGGTDVQAIELDHVKACHAIESFPVTWEELQP